MNGGRNTATIFFVYYLPIKKEKHFASPCLYASKSIFISVSSPNGLNTSSIPVDKASL